MLLLRLVHDGFARGENPLAVRVSGRIRQVADHVLLDFLGRIETEHGEVADVELDDLLPLFLHLLGAIHDRAANVVEHVGQFGRFFELFQMPSRAGDPKGLYMP